MLYHNWICGRLFYDFCFKMAPPFSRKSPTQSSVVSEGSFGLWHVLMIQLLQPWGLPLPLLEVTMVVAVMVTG